ncbi:MAG: response regulator [Tannerella sp.]|jgi:signal transduction histidine kinase/ligand-binding sensor domain-containing protein/DNA-binding response OmpR family regulator|nr:response regulator [Tannerella sp.]
MLRNIKHIAITILSGMTVCQPAASQIRKIFSTDNGLSGSLINQVYQDRPGFVWIATEYGLNRFDGKRFSVYKHIPGDSSSLTENYVQVVFEDRSGNFYVGTIGGLMKYDRATDSFRRLALMYEGKPVAPHIMSIIQRRNGEIWLTTSGLGVFSAANGSDTFFAETSFNASLNSLFLTVIYEDSQQHIWTGSSDDGLHRYHTRTRTVTHYRTPAISGNNITSIAEDARGYIYAGTLTEVLNRYDPSTQTFRPVVYGKNTDLFIKSLVFDRHGNLYIGTDGQGLKKYNPEKDVIEDCEIHSPPLDFSKAKIHSVMFDRHDNMWLGIFQKGLLLVPTSESKFDYYGYRSYSGNPIGSNPVTAICRDRKEGLLWIGTDNDGIYGVNERGERVAHFYRTASPRSAPNVIHSIYEDGNYLWLGSYTSGLSRLNLQTGDCEYIPAFNGMQLYCVAKDSRGRLLAGTYGSGFFILDDDGNELEHYESSKSESDIWTVDELANDWINCLLCDRSGLIWIGHYKGLSCFDPVRKTFLTYLDRNNLIPGSVVQALAEDEAGNIWAGTASGLYCFDRERTSVRAYTTVQGLPNDVICGICTDDENNIWVSTYGGIGKFIVRDGRFANYYAADGLQGNEFSRGAAFRDRDGKIYFGGMNGVTAFHPDKIVEERRDLNISLTNFYVSNRSVRKGDKSGNRMIVTTSVFEADAFTLSYTDHTLSFELSTFDFLNPERIFYQYRMEGFDSDWMSTAVGENRITYNNLMPGTYRFHVKAYDNNNSSPVKTVTVTITPPWYRTWPAYTVYLILAILIPCLIVGYIRARIRHRHEMIQKDHAEKINEAKLQFFINISHEIRTPMTLIINPLERLIAESGDDDKQPIYRMIYRNAQRILKLVNQLMDIRKLDKGQMKLKYSRTDIAAFVDDLMAIFEYQAKKKNIRFMFEHGNTPVEAWIDRDNFDKVLLNILSNAFKYTPENGEIKISLTTGRSEPDRDAHPDAYFEIVVSDTGSGISEDEIEKIFERFYQAHNEPGHFGTGIGLHLARLLVELHRGTIHAENRTDTQGCRFVVRMPMGDLSAHTSDLPPATGLPRDRSLLAGFDGRQDDAPKTVKSKTKYTVLIVEDEDEIRQYLKAEFSPEYRIREARNGREALEIVLKDRPNLVISDVMMPEMDGITFCRKMKHNININHIPIILLTARSRMEDKIEGLGTGADGYMEKPVNMGVLKQTAANLIRSREVLKNKFTGNQQQEDRVKRVQIKSSDEILMEKIMKTINENLSNPALNVEMLAGQVGMSRVHMHRKLKDLTSQSARDFIRGIRLSQAAILLSSGKYTVSEVAYATGFTNLSHFSSAFKTFYGVAPSEYAAGYSDMFES